MCTGRLQQTAARDVESLTIVSLRYEKLAIETVLYMAQRTSSDRPKSIAEISYDARELLKRITPDGQIVLRLTGAPLELIGHQLATFTAVGRGYFIETTEAGAQLLIKAGEISSYAPRKPQKAKRQNRPVIKRLLSTNLQQESGRVRRVHELYKAYADNRWLPPQEQDAYFDGGPPHNKHAFTRDTVKGSDCNLSDLSDAPTPPL